MLPIAVRAGFRLSSVLARSMYCSDEVTALVHALEFLPSAIKLKLQQKHAGNAITPKAIALLDDVQTLLNTLHFD